MLKLTAEETIGFLCVIFDIMIIKLCKEAKTTRKSIKYIFYKKKWKDFQLCQDLIEALYDDGKNYSKRI